VVALALALARWAPYLFALSGPFLVIAALTDVPHDAREPSNYLILRVRLIAGLPRSSRP
jgi:hypothetical protein